MDDETRAALTAAAEEIGVEATGLMAVAEVESGARAFASFAGRREPLIRFEGHYFDRRLSGSKLAQARQGGLAHPIAGRVANPADQAARWALLDRAIRIDRKAALESTSWGLGQVMGAHWAWLGYAGAEELVAEARSGATGQARLMARFIVKAGLADALRAQDWQTFARGYNGPAFRRNAYDTRLAAAYGQLAADASQGSSDATLARGAAGAAVADLQRALAAAGYLLEIDGRFGPATADALASFQRDHGLRQTGRADGETLEALAGGLSLAHRLMAFWRWLLERFGRR